MSTLVQRFRWGAYLWFTLVVLLFGGGRMVGAVYFVLVPWLFESLPAQWRKRLRHVEEVLTPAVAGFLALPALAVAAVLGALITGRVAERGLGVLPGCVVITSLGWLVGAGVTPLETAAGSYLADLACVVFVAGLAVPLVALGYTRVTREKRGREVIESRAGRLEQHIDGLQHYLSPQVSSRVAATPLDVVFHERRWLTVAFVDLVDFTSLTEALAPEQLSSTLSEFLGVVADITAQGRGTVDKFLGDGALVFFHEADRSRAAAADACVNVLVEVVAAMDALNDVWQEQGLAQRLDVCCAAASGFCTVGDFGATRRDFTVVGPPVNLASRMLGPVPPGEIWVSAATRSLLAERWATESAGRRELKGLREPVELFRVLSGVAVDGSAMAL